MPTRPYSGRAAERRASWQPETREMARRLGDQLDAELSAQKALGAQFADARRAAHLTQPQLAERSGVQQADISRLESGHLNATRDTLLKMVDALGMELVLRPKQAAAESSTTATS